RSPDRRVRGAIVLLAVAAWLATLASGVHATIAGVALGLLTPAGPSPEPSAAERLERALHPWTSYVVVPLFALANAGVSVAAGTAALASPIALGIVLGLVAGKLVGIAGAAWLACRMGLGVLPDGVAWPHVVGAAAVGGIGFTVSLFVAHLAFADAALLREATMAVLAGSALAAALGVALLWWAARVSPAATRS
ncbi:MAG: Na+/H+ antiporter NhaA, partial [Candidatus Limnocylindria bacterium]